MPRPDGRLANDLRPVKMTPDFLHNAKSSVLIECGRTRVLCAVSVVPGVPRWMKEQGVPGGWLTSEYSMLPAAGGQRKQREISNGRPDGRTQEIQRLVGRSLRAVVDLSKLGDNTWYVDCDVLDADGGTRCASITGAAVALMQAFHRSFARGELKHLPMTSLVAAVSVGMVNGEAVLDLPYQEDVAAAVDMNLVMTENGRFVEVQGSGEEATFSRAELDHLLSLGEQGIKQLLAMQRQALQAAAG